MSKDNESVIADNSFMRCEQTPRREFHLRLSISLICAALGIVGLLNHVG